MTQSNDKYGAFDYTLSPINSQLALLKPSRGSHKRIVPNPAAFLRAMLIANFHDKKLADLPYLFEINPYPYTHQGENLEQWWCALSRDKSALTEPDLTKEQFMHILDTADFFKPCDMDIPRRKMTQQRIEVDADDIELGHGGE